MTTIHTTKRFAPFGEPFNYSNQSPLILMQATAFWEKRAGPLLFEMLENRQAAERFLEHPEPGIRMVALEVLCHHWEPDANLARSSERMALTIRISMCET